MTWPVRASAELNVGRVIELTEYAEKLVQKHDDSAVIIFRRTGIYEADVVGVYNGKNIKTMDRGGKINISRLKHLVPKLKDRKNLETAMLKAFDEAERQTVEYISIASGKAQKRSVTFVKHAEDIVMGIVRQGAEIKKRQSK